MADCILPLLKSKINTNQFDFALFLDDIERNETGAWLIPNGKTQADISRWFVASYLDETFTASDGSYSIYRPGQIYTGYIHPTMPDRYWVYNSGFDTTTRTIGRQLTSRYVPMQPGSSSYPDTSRPLFLLGNWV